MLLLNTLLASFLMFGFGEASEDRLRCNVGDAKCEKIMYNAVLEKYACGIPEIGVPPADPIELKDISVSILGVLNLTLINGVGRGIHKCKFVDYSSSIAKLKKVKIHKECNITVEGRFRISFCDPAVKELLEINVDGASDGEGNGTIELNDFNMFLDFPYTLITHDDGDIYVKSFFNDITCTKYEFKEIKFNAKELFFDSQKTNNYVEKFLNENSSYVMTAVSRDIINKIMQFYYKFSEKFFQKRPAKCFYKGDLAPLVTN